MDAVQSDIFVYLGESISNTLEAFVTPAVLSMVDSITVMAVLGVTLYITLTGYAIATGSIQSPVPTFIKQCAKIVLISIFALNAGSYTENIMGTLQGLEVGLTEALSQTNVGQNIYEVLDESLSKGLELTATCFEMAHRAGWDVGAALGWVVAGLAVGIGTLVITLLGGALVIVAKFSLAILFAIGPLFILSLMFPMTAKFFDGWFSQVLNYTLTVVFIAIVMSFSMVAFQSYVEHSAFDTSGDKSPIIDGLQILGVAGVLGWITLQVGGMASGLAGGVSMAAMNLRQIASPASVAKSGAAGLGGVGRLANRTSTRMDLSTGRQITQSRAAHMLQGNTKLNPAYRQHVRENLTKNWRRRPGGEIK